MHKVSQRQKQAYCCDLVSPASPNWVAKHQVRAINPHLMQQALSNQAIQQMLRSGMIRAKLKINSPDDMHEQEADRVADQVMRMPDPLRTGVAIFSSSKGIGIQRACPLCDDEELQRQPLEEEENEEILQTKRAFGRTPEVAPALAAQVTGLHGRGQPIPKSVRDFFEPRFGRDFSDVQIHTDSQAAEINGRLHARAYTLGKDIAFAPGEYRPMDTEGKHLFAHELAHVAQQSPNSATNRSHSLAASISRIEDHHIQRELIAEGDVQGFSQLANRIIGYRYRVVVSPQGMVSLHNAPDGDLTSEAEELVSVLELAISNSITTVRFVHSTPITSIGEAGWPQFVDLDDLEWLGIQREVGEHRGGTAGSFLVHELREAFQIQAQARHMRIHSPEQEMFGEFREECREGEGYIDEDLLFCPAHEAALESEALAAGAPRREFRVRTWTGGQQNRYCYNYSDGTVAALDISLQMPDAIPIRVCREVANPRGEVVYFQCIARRNGHLEPESHHRERRGDLSSYCRNSPNPS